MKYLFLLLVLTACGAPKAETKQEAAEISSSLEAFVPKTKEDLDKLRTPVPSYEVLNRLVRTEDNDSFYVYKEDGTLSDSAYLEIYMDTNTFLYYAGTVERTNYSSNFIDNLSYKDITNCSLENKDRLVAISNLSPSKRVILDAGYFPQRTNLYIQEIRKTPDPYYWDIFEYPDDEGNSGRMYNINGSLTNDVFYLPVTNTAEYWKIYYIAYTNISAPPLTQDHIIRSRFFNGGDIMGVAESYPEGRFP